MAGSYLDTNLVVAALTAEPFTETAQPYLLPVGSTSPALSDWTVTEFSAALSIKVRVGALTDSAHEVALAAFRRFLRDAFVCLQVTRADFQAAAGLADQASTGLRAGDALHLALGVVERRPLTTSASSATKRCLCPPHAPEGKTPERSSCEQVRRAIELVLEQAEHFALAA